MILVSLQTSKEDAKQNSNEKVKQAVINRGGKKGGV